VIEYSKQILRWNTDSIVGYGNLETISRGSG
jgi:hypothetical protein